jgi:hypothetical protein
MCTSHLTWVQRKYGTLSDPVYNLLLLVCLQILFSWPVCFPPCYNAAANSLVCSIIVFYLFSSFISFRSPHRYLFIPISL